MKLISMIMGIVVLNFMFFLSQTAIAKISDEVRPGDESIVFFDPGGNMIDDFSADNYTLIDPSTRIPSDNEAVDPDSGSSWITDMWKTLKNSLYEST